MKLYRALIKDIFLQAPEDRWPGGREQKTVGMGGVWGWKVKSGKMEETLASGDG